MTRGDLVHLATAAARSACLALLAASAVAPAAAAAGFQGRVTDSSGEPIPGAMATFRRGEPLYERTVFSDEAGHFTVTDLVPGGEYAVRVRRIGWRDHREDGLRAPATGAATLEVSLARETDPAAVAAQLPANRWYGLLLDRIEDPEHREQLVRQCTYCHQQGNRATRILREDWQWEKLLALMARMGGTLDEDLRARIPELFNGAYDPATAVPALTRDMHSPDFAPPPPPRVRAAVIDEYELGGRASMQHDIVVHPDGHVYSVDMMQDALFRLDPRVPGGRREMFPIPRGDLPLGGAFGTGSIMPPNANTHVGPHSLQVAPDGGVWVTLAIGNQLGRFDPQSHDWTIETLPGGYYPHTLRFDGRGRIWYSIAVSNHLGVYDPSSGRHEVIRLPARSFGEAVSLRLLPAVFWLARRLDLGGLPTGDGSALPVPYGVDVAPDGSVWFSQLNAHRIGRIDPDSFDVEMVDTPFTGPRRLRFDSQGGLWIPGFSSGLVSRFDPASGEFRSWELPIEPRGTETPYALNVDAGDGVWICGTNSDSLIRFDPGSEEFTVYPLPTRVTYTRELDFDESGNVWTSNSNLPAWQIETGIPRVLRLDPGPGRAGPGAVAERSAAAPAG
jgi:streptogramin lyase